jgi:phage host-nuclease inhibitor protein Gam
MTINNWKDVDQALKKIGELDIAIEKVNGDLTLKVNELKNEAKEKTDGLSDEKKELEKSIKGWCEAHKEEFAKKRSRKMDFGTVGYRLVESISIPRVKDKVAALLKSLKAYGHKQCIKTEEAIDKDELVKLPDSDLVKLGLQRKTKDNFRIEPDIVKIQEG